MIGYLQGSLLFLAPLPTASNNSTKQLPARTLILGVQGLGYEVLVPQKLANGLTVGQNLALYTHLQVREDALTLYGFATIAERDMFRQLIAVAGIGSQSAMSLLNTLGLADLVRAIITGNTRLLSMAQGVGSKTAERLALELKSKLAEWRTAQDWDSRGNSILPSHLQEDVEMTLLALGYSTKEINQALLAVSVPKPQQADLEVWLKSAIAWLSQNT
jgi:Holliday junction DNA helicase RuvA